MSAVLESFVPTYLTLAQGYALVGYEDYIREVEKSASQYTAYLHDATEMELPAALLCFFEVVPQDDGPDLLLDRVFLGRMDVTWLIRTAGLVDDITEAAYRDATKQREQSRTENRIAAMEGA